MKIAKILLLGLYLSGFLGNGAGFAATPANLTQTVSGGGVTAKVTYLNSGSNEDPRFLVVLDTHSVNLDAYDPKSIFVLRDDGGKTYTPTAVENKGSGHHRESSLTFAKPAAEVKRLEIVIKDVAGVKERIFRWNLE